jgi:hypothetical protein
MARVRVLDYYGQTSWKDELSQVEYLLKCLGKERNTCYRIIDRPDIRNRQSPQPDYLIKNNKTGDLITIEYTRLFESERKIQRTANLAKKSGVVSQWINFPTSEELGKRLSEFVAEKLSKGQFRNFSQTERILLAIDQWGGIKISTLAEAKLYFKLPKLVDCDHFYLILIADPILAEVL